MQRRGAAPEQSLGEPLVRQVVTVKEELPIHTAWVRSERYDFSHAIVRPIEVCGEPMKLQMLTSVSRGKVTDVNI